MSRKRPPHQKDRRDQRPGPPRDPDARREAPPAFQGRRQERHGTPKVPADVALIWGYHAVREALRSERRKILRIMATDAAAEKLAGEIAAKNLRADIVPPEQIAQRLPQDAVHQGVLVEARHLPDLDLEDLPENGFILVLDQVTDPHNVGAILRTAAAFALDAIVTTERHSPALTGVLAKTASGGLEHVPIVSVVNLARALEKLGQRGYLRVGLDSEGPRSLEDETLSRPLALVLGAEGKGLRRLSRENCDVLARLDMPGAIKSLNVSNACAVALTIARMKLSPKS
jgi:23S rRNA (guanosine2251-2'-O)-methyltransferase